MSNFHVGQRVCCILREQWTDEDHISSRGVCFPRYGDVLTIRTTCLDHFGELFLRFAEIINPSILCHEGRMEPDFWSAGFRPLIETDISIFQAILANPHKELETAE